MTAGRLRITVFGLVVSAGCSAGGGGGDPGPAHPSPDVDGRVTINELQARNVLTAKDGAGAASAWIELYNPGDQDLALDGYTLTDDLAAPGKTPVPAGSVLPAHGVLVLWLDGAAGAAALNGDGGVIALARPDGSFIDRVAYGHQTADFSAAREPDGSDAWVIEWHASPGASNPAGAGQVAPAEDPSAPPEQVPETGDLSEHLLGYDQTPSFELTLAPEAIDALRAAPRSYVQGMVTVDGRSYGPVGVRLKGQNSFEPIDGKPSLRISIDQYADGAEVFGLKDLTLDNMHSDPSMMHERMAYWVARMAGVPASRANHAMVTINGQLYGLYANVESVKKKMVARWFTDASGSLYEATDVDFTAALVPGYTLESGADDRSLLSGVASALTASDADAAIAAAGAYANMPEFRRFWAMCSVVGQFDSMPYSFPGDDYHVYADPQTKRLWFMPWGMDETFQSPEYDVKKVFSVLATTCEGSASCLADYARQTWDILSMVEQADWIGEHDRVAAQIAPFTVMDRRKAYSDAEVEQGQNSMALFMYERRQSLQTMLPAGQ